MAPITVSLSDIEALVVRLLHRARSIVMNDQPDLQADLLLAGKILKALVTAGDIWVPIELD